MPWDWVSVAIVLLIFLGFATAVMGLAFESVETGASAVSAASEEDHWNEWVMVLEDMSHKAALTERAMKQLAIIKETAEIVLYNYNQRIDLSK